MAIRNVEETDIRGSVGFDKKAIWHRLFLLILPMAMLPNDCYGQKFTLAEICQFRKFGEGRELPPASMGIEFLSNLAPMRRQGLLDELPSESLAEIDLAIKSVGTTEGYYNFRDPKFSDRLFQLVGPEILLSYWQDGNVRSLDITLLLDDNPDPSWLSDSWMEKRLVFSDSQLEKRDQLLENLRAGYQKRINKIMELAEELQQSQWKESLNLLNQEQRAIVEKTIGEPGDWYRYYHETPRFISAQRSTGTGMYVRDIMGPGRFMIVQQFSQADIEAMGVTVISSIVYEMLHDEFMQRELEITDHQKQSLASRIFPQLKEKGLRTGEYRDERIESAIQGDVDFPKDITSLLLPPQLETLRQLELQVGLWEHQSTFGLTDPRMVKRLDLSRQQVDDLKKVAQDFEAQRTESVGSAKSEIAAYRATFVPGLLGILNEPQRHKYFLITGIDVDKLLKTLEASDEQKPPSVYQTNSP